MKKSSKQDTGLPGYLAQKLFNELPLSIVLLNKRGEIIETNQYFLSWAGKTRKAVLGRNLLSTGGIRHKSLEKKYRSLLSGGTAFYNYLNTTYSPRQKRWYSLSISGIPVKDLNGKLIGAFSIAQDLSESEITLKKAKQSNQELERRIKEYMTQVGKLAAKLKQALKIQTRFFGDASHELRTPLTIIKGNLDLIYLEQKKHPLDDHLFELVNNINVEMKRMTALLSDITFLNTTDTEGLLAKLNLALKPMSLDDLVSEVVQTSGSKAQGQNIKVETKLVPVRILGDRQLIKKALIELVSNAFDYNVKNGLISISLKAAKNFAYLKIRDTGIGIPKADLPHIFERFYRTTLARGRVGGSGLGLAIAKRIILEHRGSISAKSLSNKGTLIIVKLPVAGAGAVAGEKPGEEFLHNIAEKFLGPDKSRA